MQADGEKLSHKLIFTYDRRTTRLKQIASPLARNDSANWSLRGVKRRGNL